MKKGTRIKKEIHTTELGEMIRQYRVQNRITQEKLAKRLGVNRNTIHLWETQAGRPSMSAMIALSDLFGVSLTDILRLADKPCMVHRTYDSVRKRQRLSPVAHHKGK